ncbi:MAG: aminopeptidase P family protein [Candidatus Competibacteraceae bacterium]|nr:aminopeptidase P family protein [Candidatus Competibacteraceae bacterium]
MRYTPAPAELYIHNRKKLFEKLLPNSIVIIDSNDVMPTNADGTMGFKQYSDLLFLSGIDQEETLLVLYPDAKDSSQREILFVRETNEKIAIWEGAKLNKEQAKEISGINTIQWVHEFDSILKGLMADADNVYVSTNEHTRRSGQVEIRNLRLIHKLQEQYPVHQYRRLAPIISRLRSIKHPHEITLIKKACEITGKGFRRLLSFVKQGVTEYEIEAELMHEFLRNRSRGFAYGPIIASGAGSCVLHYIENNKTCQAGDILLLDVAAEYANYASDLTRCIPVSGTYTTRQKAVYNAVLRVHKQAVQMLKPGNTIKQVNEDVGLLVEKELVDLGLITTEDIRNQNPAWPAYKKYFMHGTSHFLGLDVHDVGYFNEPIQPGMIFTCEPGIYIREENLGIRIENDILVSDNEPIDLMHDIPIEADEIEELMNA